MILAQLYPDYHFFFNALMCIDIFSHWFHVMSTAGDGHHKSDATLEHRNIVLRCYYAVPFLFAYCCVGAELFYVLLYVMHFNPHPLLHQVSASSALAIVTVTDEYLNFVLHIFGRFVFMGVSLAVPSSK